jgi:hypothetical protein
VKALQVNIFVSQIKDNLNATSARRPKRNSHKIQMSGPLHLFSAMLESSLVQHKIC